MNETISVAMNGNCVTMMVKTRAGSNGARRAQSPDRRKAPPVPADRLVCPRRLLVSVATLMPPPPSSHRRLPQTPACGCAGSHGTGLGGSSGLPGAVALGDVVRELLPAFQRLVDAHLARDGGADVLRDLGAEIG